jgi:hypothetical protein
MWPPIFQRPNRNNAREGADVAAAQILRFNCEVYRVSLYRLLISLINVTFDRLKSGALLAGMEFLVDVLTSSRKTKSRPFVEARAFVHTLKLASSSAWRDFCASGKRPPDIPSNPQVTYHLEWQSWGDWLGTGRSRSVVQSARYKFRSFASARDFARALGFTGSGQWRLYAASAKRPPDIPSNPQIAYRLEWKGWGDWLGTGNTKNSFLLFEEARQLVHSLGVQSGAEFYAVARSGELPAGVPKDPQAAYRNSGWKGWGDFVGTGKRRKEPKSAIVR